ncbi:MAG: 5-formyltetrahydrofolate cyclo-ligase [Candidatus Baldrarchaeia archaeon]
MTKDEKQKIREYIWNKMEREGIARFPLPCKGRIPNFIGAEKAAGKLRQLPEYKNAKIIFCNPDSPQRPVREMILRDNKILVMATPRLKEGFLILDPSKIPKNKYREASTIRGAFKWGTKTHPSKIKIDIKITGSVAVSPKGGRVGKGGGYSDLEYGILKEYGAVDERTPIITTVHDIQVVDNIPMTEHDMPIDIIVTPTKIIRTNTKYKKPRGILWEHLTKEKIEQIPLIKHLRKSTNP